MTKLRTRTFLSFTLLILGLLSATILWQQLLRQEMLDEQPAVLRQVLELNGQIWKKFSRATAVSACKPPAKGKRPRVNGDIGLSQKQDLQNWRLEVIFDEQDAKSKHLTLTIEDLTKLPRSETATELRCIEGSSEEMSFAGIKFLDFMAYYGIEPLPFVGLETPDGSYYVSVDIESMQHSQTLLAYQMNGAPLAQENGAPLRLVIPTKYGIKNIKRIGKIYFSRQRPKDYWAERGYDWHASL